MKDRKLQTKRKAKKGFRALYAKTMERRQKASASAAVDIDDIEGDIPRVGIGRALTVILILHIVAIAAIYVGTKWKGADSGGSNAVAAYNEDDSSPEVKDNSKNQHKFRVSQPSSYQQFQRSPNVSHQLPAEESESVAAEQTQPRQPRVIRPKRNPNAHVNLPPAQTVNYKSYTIKSGDSIYRIALRNEVKQQEILDLNNITDARKVRVGAVIKIPVK